MAPALSAASPPTIAPQDPLLLVGVGSGAAPVLALLRQLPDDTDVIVVLRGSTPAELVLRDQIAGAVERCGGRLVELTGPRDPERLDAAALSATVADLRRREAYVCGPGGASRRLAGLLRRAGVAERRMHVWSFAR
jgi:ferredoxin-NADP reductase